MCVYFLVNSQSILDKSAAMAIGWAATWDSHTHGKIHKKLDSNSLPWSPSTMVSPGNLKKKEKKENPVCSIQMTICPNVCFHEEPFPLLFTESVIYRTQVKQETRLFFLMSPRAERKTK